MLQVQYLLLGIVILSFCIYHTVISSDPDIEEEELIARDFMAILNKESEEDDYQIQLAEWEYENSLNDEALKKKAELNAEVSEKSRVRWLQLNMFNWKNFRDPFLKRQFLIKSKIGAAALSKEEIIRNENILGAMAKVYSTAKICDLHNSSDCSLFLNPEINEIHAKSRDEKELKHVWVNFRNAIGPHIRHHYRDYVHLQNKAAHLNGFNTTDEMWVFTYNEYGKDDIKKQVEPLWEQIKPLYEQLHAYVRYRLRKLYGNDVVSEKGPIPAHLLGNVWAQTWVNLAQDFRPFPNAPEENLDGNLKKQGYTVKGIFEGAEEFFASIGLFEMTDSFWDNSVLVKPKNKDIICHASARDFKRGDYRIKMCAGLNFRDFIVAHHEMGHIEYYMAYKDQPYVFRAGANPGFHEAVGDLITLSVTSVKHLKQFNLTEADFSDSDVILNKLFETGMHYIPFVPYSFTIDSWRWGVFSDKIHHDDYNCEWWKIKEAIQGIEPPVERSEEDFDPGAKFHISNDVPYVRYFVAKILQFQFHRAACELAGEYEQDNPQKPLHLCDIYKNKKAGNALRKMLELGASKPWPEALEVLTGQKEMDASALLEYFRPLHNWLEKENKKNGAFVGWEKGKIGCVKKSKK